MDTRKFMGGKKNLGGDEPVNLDKKIVDRVRANKQKTGVPISTFFERAAVYVLNIQELHESERVVGKK